jgi:N-sulfoglucosamine sulfohydrolase
MNILYLNSHDTGRYIQPYGYAVRTPNLQRLAATGTLFRDAHCVAPTCSPSRAGLLTGQSAHEAGMVALAHRGGRLVHPERHIANFLKEQGYETVKAGFTHVGEPTAPHGYTVNREADWKNSEDTTAYAVECLRSYAAADPASRKPLYLDVGFFETHRAGGGFNLAHHNPKDGDGDPGCVMPPAVLPDHPDTRRDWLDYQHSLERLDGCYGRILDALEDTGLADDTLVLATTDHGLAFPDMKCKLTQHGTGVLQIIRFPKGLGRGRVIDALVSHLDFYPTVCDLLGVEQPVWLEGRSLLPLVRGEADALHEAVFSEVTFHGAFEPKRGVRTKRWNYIRNFAAPHTVIMPNCDNGHSKRLWVAHGLRDRAVPPEELYDLMFDPMERNNLLALPRLEKDAGEILRDLRSKLDSWMQSTNDPLLGDDPGVMPMPQTVNTWDQMEPMSGDGASEWDPSDWKKIRRSF